MLKSTVVGVFGVVEKRRMPLIPKVSGLVIAQFGPAPTNRRKLQTGGKRHGCNVFPATKFQ